MGARLVSTLTIVDTDILIDAARQAREAVECLADIEQQSALAISAITQMELLVGCRRTSVVIASSKGYSYCHILNQAH